MKIILSSKKNNYILLIFLMYDSSTARENNIHRLRLTTILINIYLFVNILDLL